MKRYYKHSSNTMKMKTKKLFDTSEKITKNTLKKIKDDD